MPTAAHKGLLAEEACWPGWRFSVDVFMAIPSGDIKSLARNAGARPVQRFPYGKGKHALASNRVFM
jgi:hypothetical protein